MAKYCSKCGKEIADDTLYCSQCGKTTSAEESDLKTNTQDKSQKSKSSWLTKTNVIIIAVLVIGFSFGLYVIDQEGHSSELEITVTSTHITEDVDLIVYVDGEEFGHYSNLEPGNSCKITGNFYYSAFDSSKLIEIKAVSVGGGLGSQTDTESIIVEPNGSYAVTLYV